WRKLECRTLLASERNHDMPILISTEAQQFTKEIGRVCDDLELITIECGLHSGFPRCCVLFFVGVYWPLAELAYHAGVEIARWPLASYRAAIDAACGIERPGYIPCPSCLLARNFVTVKDCHCGRKRTIKLAKG